MSRISMMDKMVEAAALALYEAERARGERCNSVLSRATGKPISGLSVEPWEECAEVFRSDARAALEAAMAIPAQPQKIPAHVAHPLPGDHP